ncbi:hypothetical protein H5410_001512 [Solanum commersonii]|uniref:Knottins-like domain-containing protein n=1 Tax=Solanum commersonii TaxID=4109 RepID=A0A9J6AZW3_SOLCO|nr:hypothetical protein H5410_001512 [Solanum commersonii]
MIRQDMTHFQRTKGMILDMRMWRLRIRVEEMQVAESTGCEKKSVTWSWPCFNTQGCNNQCINWEHAIHGACHMDWTGPACYCYFC